MQQNDYFSGIVVYTIHDNDALRNALRKGIQENYNAKWLDESTYGISIQGIIPKDVINTLTKVCNKACSDSESKYSRKDFVCLYRPTYAEESQDERNIKQIYIIPPKEND